MSNVTREDQISSPDAEFGRAVAQLRQDRNLNQKDLAALLAERGMKVDAAAVSRIESGARSVRLAEAFKIADALDAELPYLLYGVGSTPEQELRSMRSQADRAMANLAEPIADFLEKFAGIHDHLSDHPDLLPLVRDPQTGDTPDNIGDYFRWVESRMKSNAEARREKAPVDMLEDPGVIVYRDQREKNALLHLLLVFADGQFVKARKDADDGSASNPAE